MTLMRIRHSSVPAPLVGLTVVGRRGVPRFWASIWSDVLKAGLADGTRRLHLRGVDRLYLASERQLGHDCLDEILSNLDFDALQSILTGFLAQLRNEAAVDQVDRSSSWLLALQFVTDVLKHCGPQAGRRAEELEGQLRRLDRMYGDLLPNPPKPPAPIRALPATVLEDLYAIFDPTSPRNPFRSERQRWRNLLVFLLLLRLGLRRGEDARLLVNSLKDELELTSGCPVFWLDVDTTDDEDPRYDKPGLKTVQSRRQLPIPEDVQILFDRYSTSYRARSIHPHLLISQKRMPLSLRMLSEIFEGATHHLSEAAIASLRKQGLSSVSCHDLRHTAAVVRLKKYRDRGDDLDTAIEKLRSYFGWSRTSHMPRLYANAYFETALAEVWDEKFDDVVDAVRRSVAH
jgi:integrase